MTTTVTTMASTRSDGQAGYVPRLRYRNSIPMEGSLTENEAQNEMSSDRIPPTASIRQIRDSMPRSPTAMPGRNTAPQSVQQKKKSSLFGGLFVKEPSMAALDIVAAQMMDKHGKISPTTLPHVSSAKMPEHVPKVNAKWDGVPEAVKVKEQQARQKQKAVNRTLPFPSTNNPSRSTESSGNKQLRRRTSNAESWDSRSTGSQPTFQDNPRRPDSVYSSDSGDSYQPIQRPASIKSQQYKTASGADLPPITSFFPNDIQATATMPQRGSSSNGSNTYHTALSERPGFGKARSDLSTNATPATPEHSASPLVTPPDEVPRTPLPLSDDENMDIVSKRRGMVIPAKLNIPITQYSAKRYSMQPIDAFLAGEAKPLEVSDDESEYNVSNELPVRTRRSTFRLSQGNPIAIVQQDLEKRPDSSRARLGLHASMIVPGDSAPWESGAGFTPPQSPKSPMSPRAKFRLLRKG